MSANDPGHINNLDRNQREALKKLWLKLIEWMRNAEDEISSIYEHESFIAIGYDNPDSILLRWLRARKWDVNDALQQFIGTIKWRYEWGVKELVTNGEIDLCADEIRTGKNYFMGQDRAGRPISYVSVKDHVKGQFPSVSTEKITVFTMETGRKLLKTPTETVTVVFDMTDFGLRNMDYQHVKFLINLLENYYPESLGLGLIINSPWIFNGCWYIIKPWLDPVVESKIHFIKNFNELTQFIDPSVLPKRLKGTHSDYNYIPPTDEDLKMLKALRNDQHGRQKAEENHQEAIRNFIQITEKWANEDETNDLLEKRIKATIELSNAYEQLIPYISTKTHYHRVGEIHEPIFDIVYQQIQETKKE